MELEVNIEWEMVNKSQSIPTDSFFFWFKFTVPFETSDTALCGTTGLHWYEKHIQCDSCGSVLWCEL